MGSEFEAVASGIQSQWSTLFVAKDWPGLSALYTEELAFYGSTPEINGTRAAVLAYFETLTPSLVDARFGDPTITALTPDSFAASGPVVFIAVTAQNRVELNFRMTQVFVREGASWRIAVHHASASPGLLLEE